MTRTLSRTIRTTNASRMRATSRPSTKPSSSTTRRASAANLKPMPLRSPRREMPNTTRELPRRRLLALLAILALLVTGLAWRVARVQLVSGDTAKFRALGVDQRVRTVSIPGARGVIFDRNGDELAVSVPQPTIWANPRLVEDPKVASEILAAEFNLNVDKVREALTRDAQFVYIARKVDPAAAKRVADRKLPGIYQLDEPKRFYPSGELAAPLLGSVGLDNQGLAGIESSNESSLAGHSGKLVAERDRRGREIPGGLKEFTPAVRGTDMVLTIDRQIQYEAERLLAHQITATNALGGMLMVMDTKTGDLLAVANLQVDQRGGAVRQAGSNTAAVAVYEPGSVSKLVTISAALAEGQINPNTVFNVPDHMILGPHNYTDHDPHEDKAWTTTDILTNSSNIGTIQIAQKLGKDKLDGYMRSFGYGAKSTLNWPGESSGLMLPPKDWVSTTMGSVPIGQGVSVTGLQMLAACNTIANGGVYVPPRMVQATIDETGARTEKSIEGARQVVTKRVASQVAGMLTQVVDIGTGTHAKIEGYSVAGKTGTARKPLAGGSGYKDGAYISSFAGFFPAENPQITMNVVLDEPNPIYGGLTAAPLFAEMGKYVLRAEHIAPADSHFDLQSLGVPVTDEATAKTGGDNDAAGSKNDGAVRPSDALLVQENSGAVQLPSGPTQAAIDALGSSDDPEFKAIQNADKSKGLGTTPQSLDDPEGAGLADSPTTTQAKSG